MTELGGSQITSLLEALPGIAQVLRSPVADAMVNMIRAGARIREFQLKDAEELVNYAVRRGLLGQTEGDQVLAEARAAAERRQEKAAERAAKHVTKVQQAKAAAPAKPAPAPAAKLARPVATKPAPARPASTAKPAARKPAAKAAARPKPKAAARPRAKAKPARKR
ncbi:MAG: hypothetical protein ACREMH_01295 [Gemmatimonadales bacterium]